MAGLYYTPPSDKAFEELKKKAIEVWSTYDDEFKYATGKIDRIKDIKNVEDNFMYMVAMFDIHNQSILASMLSTETRKEVSDRMIDGGQPDHFNPFLLKE